MRVPARPKRRIVLLKGDIGTRKVRADVYGALAITPRWRFPWDGTAAGWKVTHVPTGLALGSVTFFTKRDALKALRLAASMLPNWNFDDPRFFFRSKKLRAKAAKIGEAMMAVAP